MGALVDAVAPGLCPDWEDWDPKKPVENATEAMDLADKWLNVPKVLAPEDLVNPNVDEQSMLTYLSQFPNAKLKFGAPLRKKTNIHKVIYILLQDRQDHPVVLGGDATQAAR